MSANNRLRIVYVGSDYFLSLAGVFIYSIIRFCLMPDYMERRPLEEWLFHDRHVLAGLLLFPLLNVLLFALSGYYNNVLAKSRLDDLRNSFSVGLITTLIVYFATLINDYLPRRVQNYELLLVLWGCVSLMPFIGRTVINLLRRKAMRHSPGIYRSIIVGTPERAAQMRKRLTPEKLKEIPQFNIVGQISPDADNKAFGDIIERLRPERLIITPHPDGMQATTALITRLYRTGLNLFLSLDLYQLITARTRITSITGEPLIDITNANIPPSTINIKRVSDIVLSALALLVLSPVYAAIALAVKVDSPGPAFYKQERIGFHKRPFNIIKFRTMTADAETSGPALSHDNDTRITRVGRVLRKYRLDEIPQFWNVLKGEMSLVGPRPEREYYIDRIVERVPYYSLIHQVRPGITSWGMVKYGYASNVDEMIERLAYDLVYIENVSFGVDLKILFHTISTVLSGKGL